MDSLHRPSRAVKATLPVPPEPDDLGPPSGSWFDPDEVIDLAVYLPTEQEAVERLAAKGYEPGAPRHLSPVNLAIDAAVCRRSECARCGRRGLSFRPFHSSIGGYKALVVCKSCDVAEEF